MTVSQRITLEDDGFTVEIEVRPGVFIYVDGCQLEVERTVRGIEPKDPDHPLDEWKKMAAAVREVMYWPKESTQVQLEDRELASVYWRVFEKVAQLGNATGGSPDSQRNTASHRKYPDSARPQSNSSASSTQNTVATLTA